MNRRGVIGSLLGLVGFGGTAVAKEDKQGDEFKIKVCDVYGREFKKSELDHYVIGKCGDPLLFVDHDVAFDNDLFKQYRYSVQFLSPVDGMRYCCYQLCSHYGGRSGKISIDVDWRVVGIDVREYSYYCGFTCDDDRINEDTTYVIFHECDNIVESKGYKFDRIVTRSDGEKYRKYVVKDSGVRS